MQRVAAHRASWNVSVLLTEHRRDPCCSHGRRQEVIGNQIDRLVLQMTEFIDCLGAGVVYHRPERMRNIDS